VRRLQRDINALLGRPEFQAGTWGIAIRSLSRHEALFDLNAGKLLVPSSNMKIVTLAAAAERLGWGYTFQTQLAAAGPVVNGVLNGDLVAIGSGDPSIDDWDGAATALFASWAEELKAAGVHAIEGRLIGDDNTFDDGGLGAGWAWDDLDRSFATSIGALQFNENTAQITVAPGREAGAPARISASPPSAALVVHNLVTTGAVDTPSTVSSRRLPGSTTLDVMGSIPFGGPAIVRNVSVVNPTLYFANHLRAALIANGIDVRGPAVDIDEASAPPDRNRTRPLVTHRSPPLADLAATMMKLSQNLYAETLLKALGAWAGAPTTQGGIAEARRVTDAWSIPPGSVRQADGSGLSRYNLVTADALASILAHADGDARLRGQFRGALPAAGVDGTLENRMKRTPAQGNARAKSGSMMNAYSLAGYVTSADGEPLVFAVIANNFGLPAQSVDSAIDAIVVRLARFTRK
jgi:D-alanyl-D-alanine carboxypeptidase/D-alanyl-D-alanine-endopeptidase (penicillin-binding protein 4)